MFGFFRKEREPDPIVEYIRKQDERIAKEEAEYASAIALDVKPSVDGNKVIFDAPELESKIESKCEGMTFVMHTGSIALNGNKKIFKNDAGQTHRIEIFEYMACRLVLA